MAEEQIIKLIDKYLEGKASSEEICALNSWFDGVKNKPSLINVLSREELEQVSSKMFLKISEAINSCEDIDRENITNDQLLKRYRDS